jgi:hypothetical protein
VGSTSWTTLIVTLMCRYMFLRPVCLPLTPTLEGIIRFTKTCASDKAAEPKIGVPNTPTTDAKECPRRIVFIPYNPWSKPNPPWIIRRGDENLDKHYQEGAQSIPTLQLRSTEETKPKINVLRNAPNTQIYDAEEPPHRIVFISCTSSRKTRFHVGYS